jgi:hypothetical protein
MVFGKNVGFQYNMFITGYRYCKNANIYKFRHGCKLKFS